MNPSRALLFGFLAVLCWSTVATAFKIALSYQHVSMVIVIATGMSLILLACLLAIQGRLSLAILSLRQEWRKALLLGMLNPLIYYFVLLWAYELLPAQVAQPINYTWAIMLALLSVPFLGHKLAKTDFHAICLSALRTLSDFAKTNIKKAEAGFIKSERSLLEHQVNHPDNEGLDEAVRSVPLPNTKDSLDLIDSCYKAIGLLRESLQIPELYWHYQDTEIQEFALQLLLKYADHKEDAQNLIKETSQSWDISRMMKVDKKILELAVVELNYTDLPDAVVISEAMKLASKYSTEEGSKFINGILADIIKVVKD